MSSYNLGEARGKIVLETDFQGLKDAQTELDKFQKGTKSVDGSLMSTQDALKKTSTTAMVAGASIAGGLALAVKSASDFEFQMSAVQAVSGATADEMDQISDAALRIGKDTAFSASEAGLAMEELVKAGISVKDVLGGAADATVALAAAGGVDLPAAATLAANAMNQFNLGADDLVHVTDTIAGAANASAIDVGQFSNSLSQVGAVAKLAGLSFDDTATAIAAMGNAGVVGSDAGTSLKGVLLNLNPTTEKQIDLMTKLGLITKDGTNKFYDAGGSLKDLASISDTLGGALKGMTDAQKQATLETLFGSDAIRGAAVIAGEGSVGINKLAEAMGKTTAADVAATRLDNFKGSSEALMGSVETLAIQVGQVLLPRVRELVDRVAAAVNWFSGLSGETKSLITNFASGAAGTLLFVGGFIKLALAMAAARRTMLAYKASALGIAVAEKAAAAAKGVSTAAQWLLNAAMTANPIGIIIVAIAALVAGLVWFFSQTKIGQDIWAGFVTFLGEAWRNIVSFIQDAVGNVISFVQSHWGMLLSLLIGPLGLVIQWIVENWGKIVSFFQPAIDAIVAVFTGLWSAISSVWNGIMAVIGFVVNMIVGYFKFWWSVVTTVVGAIVAVVTGLVTFFMNHVLPVITAFIGMVAAIFNYLWLWIVFIFQSIVAAVATAVQAVVTTVLAVWGAILGFIMPIFQAIWNYIVAIFTAIFTYVSGIVKQVVGTIVAVWSAIIAIVTGIFGRVWAVVSGFFRMIFAFIAAIVRQVVSTITTVWNGIVATVSGIFGRVYTAIKSPIDRALAVIGGVKSKIMGFFSGAGNWLRDAGARIIGGFIKGLESMLGGIADFFSGVTANVPKQKGPAKVDKVLLKPAGKMIMQSLMSGLQSEYGNLMDMLSGMNVTIPAQLTQSINANQIASQTSSRSDTPVAPAAAGLNITLVNPISRDPVKEVREAAEMIVGDMYV